MARPKREVLEYRSYELPVGFPLIVLTGDKWFISSTPSSHLHFHNCLEIGFCHSGAGTMRFNRQPVDFGSGCITCVARNIPHTTWSKPDDASLWSYLFLDPEQLFGSSVFQQLALPSQGQDFLSDCHIVLSAEQAPWAESLITAILREDAQQAPGCQFSMRGYCMALLIHLLRAYYSGAYTEPAHGESEHVISPALDFIRRHYNQTFNQERLADLCHLSPSHFRRLFKAQVGVSPLTFLHQTRILNSCIFLRSSERLISEIAAMVGYDSLSSFNRHFQQIMGIAPSEWRRTSGSAGRPALLEFTGWTVAETPEGD